MVRRIDIDKPIDPLTVAIERPFLDDAAYDIVLQHAVLPDNEWSRQQSHRPALRSPATIGDLIRHVRWFLSREPLKSIIIAEAAIRVAEAQREEETDQREAAHRKGEAWQAYASALAEMEDYRRALDATITAERLYNSSGTVRPEGMPSLKLIRARILSAMGENESALLFAEDAAQIFLLYEDHARYVTARLFYANILMAASRYKEALRAFDKAAQIAKEDDNTELLAHIVASTGYALQEQANIDRIKSEDQAAIKFERARNCQDHAITMFESLGLSLEAAHVRWTIAKGFLLRGNYDEGITRLKASRDEYIRLGMPIIAAEIAVDITGALLLAGRGAWIPQLCNEAIVVLADAGLEAEGQRALAYLQEESSNRQQRKAVTEDISRAIAHVKTFLTRLRRDPSAPFEGPTEA